MGNTDKRWGEKDFMVKHLNPFDAEDNLSSCFCYSYVNFLKSNKVIFGQRYFDLGFPTEFLLKKKKQTRRWWHLEMLTFTKILK